MFNFVIVCNIDFVVYKLKKLSTGNNCVEKFISVIKICLAYTIIIYDLVGINSTSTELDS